MNSSLDRVEREYTLPLDGAGARLEIVGGKGASLARLVGAGLLLPPGFHITTAAYRAFVDANQLQARILAAVAQASPSDSTSLDAASTPIQALFMAGEIPAPLAHAVLGAYHLLLDGKSAVAVRSSATAEDLPGLSFAGQQDTYLNISGDSALLDAVRRCWASLWTARAIGYRAQHAIAPESVQLAVVVQALVLADCAGVLFTANPLNGQRNQAVINAAWGLGEAIVGGQVTPDTLVVRRHLPHSIRPAGAGGWHKGHRDLTII